MSLLVITISYNHVMKCRKKILFTLFFCYNSFKKMLNSVLTINCLI